MRSIALAKSLEQTLQRMSLYVKGVAGVLDTSLDSVFSFFGFLNSAIVLLYHR
jgi:hypothetical protein